MEMFKLQVSGLARKEDPDTSHDAAAQVDASGLMREVYRAMEKFGDAGCIADEVEEALPHLENWTISPRYVQMIERGMIEVTGEKKVGRHGRQQIVRRVLPPPFKKRAVHERVDPMKKQIGDLRSLANRMRTSGVQMEDGIRLNSIVNEIERLF